MSPGTPYRILIRTSSPAVATVLQHSLRAPNYAVTITESTNPETIQASAPVFVLWEIENDLNGLAEACKALKPTPIFVVLRTARAELAFAASKAGAEGLITLPASAESIQEQLLSCLNRPQPEPPPPAPNTVDAPSALFGKHPRMAEIRDTISKVAATSATVLIRGESGVGKDIVSRMIFEQSLRSGKPFVKVNCAAIPDDLLESELFGYEAGAFTGAVRSKPGRFELADTGTIFLDEIGEMQPALQAKLLHVLQDGAFARLGAKNDVSVDVRVLCATNKPLEERVAAGLFREDLFYRINVVTVNIPPLRERRDEIVPFIHHFLEKYAAMYSKAPAAFSEEALAHLVNYSWPGNIRELENLCKRFVIVGGERQILRELAGRVRPVAIETAPPPAPLPSKRPTVNVLEVGKQAARRAERALILETLEAVRWNRKEAAKRLGISYRSLRAKVDSFDKESSTKEHIIA